jgi:hypothetical protein
MHSGKEPTSFQVQQRDLMKTLNQQRDLMKTFIPSSAEGPEKDNNSIQQRDLLKTLISISKGTWKYPFTAEGT